MTEKSSANSKVATGGGPVRTNRATTSHSRKVSFVRRIACALLLLSAVAGLPLGLSGCFGPTTSSEPDSGPPPDPNAGAGTELKPNQQ